ncbi:MAG: S8 family serine peptidase, partial [Promethearchaeota archaeon]
MRKTKVGFAVLLTMVFLTSIVVIATPVFAEDISPTSIFMSKLEPELLAKLQENPNSVFRVVVVLNDGVSKDAARSLLLSLGGEINAEHNVINAISASIPGDKLQSVTSLGDVNKILIDGKKFLSPVPKAEENNDDDVVEDDVSYWYSQFPWQHDADEAWAMGIDGSGVIAAVLDTGLFYEHPDLAGVVLDYAVFTSEADVFPHDGYGHGTACASCIAAQAIVDWDLGVTDLYFKVKGVAPGAKILGAKVLTDAGWGWDSWIIRGIEWAVWSGADIISCSFGGLEIPNDGNDPTALALDAAAEKGVTSFVAAGNSQGFGTVASPGCAKDVITVGASTENSFPYTWLGYWPFAYADDYENDQLIFWSSGGSTADGRVDPDVSAVGAWGLTLDTHPYYLWLQFGGTSMATPVAAGVGALVIEAYRAAHGHSPEPGEVRNILMNTAEDLGYPANRQGAGRVDAYEAVLAAQCDCCYSDTGGIHAGILEPGEKYTSHLKFKEDIDYVCAERLEWIGDIFEEGLSTPDDEFLYFTVPAGTEYAQIKLMFPFNYSFGVYDMEDYDGSQWTDAHINTILYRIEEDGSWTMINYGYAHTNIQWFDASVTPGDYVLCMSHVAGEPITPVDVKIDFYEFAPWTWVSTHILGKNLKVNVKVPWGTAPGSYEGFVRVECDGDFINIPVVATVPAKTGKSFTVTANVVMEPRDSMSGDWVFIPVKVRKYRYITLTVSWFTPDADFDVYLITP